MCIKRYSNVINQKIYSNTWKELKVKYYENWLTLEDRSSQFGEIQIAVTSFNFASKYDVISIFIIFHVFNFG